MFEILYQIIFDEKLVLIEKVKKFSFHIFVLKIHLFNASKIEHPDSLYRTNVFNLLNQKNTCFISISQFLTLGKKTW